MPEKCFHLKKFSNYGKSIINEVIRAVLNLLFIYLFFYKKILHVHKAQKAQKRNQAKVKNANKQTKIKNAVKKHLRGKK